MTMTATEQYLLELMNRARLDPAGEAARMGISLNQGLAAGAISTAAKQVLAPNAMLEAAATAHSLWMLDQDVFSHTGAGNTNPGQRISAQGYAASTWGENLAYVGSTAAVTLEASIDTLNKNLFLSAEHRANTMSNSFREVGLGAEVGQFRQGSTNFNLAMLTEDFGTSGTSRYVTGVCYTDLNADNFYSLGEGKGGEVFTVGTATATSAAAGGYSVAAGTALATTVTGKAGTLNFSASVDMSHGNVKLDLVGDTKFLTSGNIALLTGIRNVDLLGVGNLNATGNAVANVMNGNAGNNSLSGRAGNDVLHAGLGNDKVNGGSGNDQMWGEAGADTFVFTAGFGTDTVSDFRLAQQDHLSLSHTLWTGIQTAAQVVSHFAHLGVGEVYFDFGGGNQIHLAGVTTLAGLDTTLIIV